MTNIDLERLRGGIMGLSSEICSFFMQACTICLEEFDHESGVTLSKTNNSAKDYTLLWQKNERITKRGWEDMQEATEYGATAIALLMAEQFSGYSYVARSSKGTGFDFWLGEEDDDFGIFQNKARLEISGILEEKKNNTITLRVKNKIKQTEQSKGLGLNAHICVTEFKGPKTEYHIVP